jgi:hypothetical protein
MNKQKISQIKKIMQTAIILFLLILLFKFVPEKIFGRDILFDASLHISLACFILYILWFFIDQNKNWRIPYLIFCLAVIIIIALHRIVINAHNDLGLLIGLIISLIAIIIPNFKKIKNKIKF